MDTLDFLFFPSRWLLIQAAFTTKDLLGGGEKKAAGYQRMTERTATKPGDESRRSPAVRQKQGGLKRRLLGPYALQQRFSLD